jgi:hypothetical protein
MVSRPNARVRWRGAVALLLALAGCGGASPDGSARAGDPDEIVLTRREACLRLAYPICKPRPGCAYRDWTGPFACRTQFMALCCQDAADCRTRVRIDASRMGQCLQQIEANYDCNRLFTPACSELIPEGTPAGGSS